MIPRAFSPNLSFSEVSNRHRHFAKEETGPVNDILAHGCGYSFLKQPWQSAVPGKVLGSVEQQIKSGKVWRQHNVDAFV